jgi:hypothetical protein
MKNRVLNIGIQALGWTGFILIMGATLVPELLDVCLSLAPSWVDAFIGGGSAMMATVTLTGPVSHETTEQAVPDHFERDVSKIITKRRLQHYAFDSLVRRIAKKEKAHQFKTEWEEVETRPRRDVTTLLYTIVGGASGETAVIDVANVSMWAEDDTGFVEGVDGNAAGTELKFLVTSVDDDNDQITISGLNGFNNANDPNVDGKRVPTIPSGSVIRRMANAKTELDASTTEKYQVPSQYYNYCQIYQQELSESEHESISKAYSGYNYDDKKEQALWDFRSSLEISMLNGHRTKYYKGTEAHYTAGGVIESISNEIEFGSGGGSVDPSVSDVIDMTQVLFSSNRGSRVRYALTGSTLCSGLDKIPIGDKRVEAMQTEVTAGFTVKTLISTHGVIHIIPTKSLDDIGWDNKAVILDFEHLIKKEYIPLKAVKMDYNTTGIKRVINAYRLEETSCVQTRYAGANGVHATWVPTVST